MTDGRTPLRDCKVARLRVTGAVTLTRRRAGREASSTKGRGLDVVGHGEQDVGDAHGASCSMRSRWLLASPLVVKSGCRVVERRMLSGSRPFFAHASSRIFTRS